MEIVINNLSDYKKFFLFDKCKHIKPEEIVICLNINFVNPHDVLLIVQFAIYTKKTNSSVKQFRIKSNPILIKYLKDIGLVPFLKENYIQPRTIKFIDKLTAMPIRRVEQSSIEEYVYETLKYIGNICIDKDLSMLSVGIKESINNVYDHANSEIGAYVFCQYYPKIKTIRVCVSDLGDGIPNVVRKANPGFSDTKCLKWALIEKNTTQSLPSNAGMGLSIIKDFTKITKGKLKILTGDCDYALNSNGNETFRENSIKPFKGTLIELDIKVDQLEDISESFDYF